LNLRCGQRLLPREILHGDSAALGVRHGEDRPAGPLHGQLRPPHRPKPIALRSASIVSCSVPLRRLNCAGPSTTKRLTSALSMPAVANTSAASRDGSAVTTFISRNGPVLASRAANWAITASRSGSGSVIVRLMLLIQHAIGQTCRQEVTGRLIVAAAGKGLHRAHPRVGVDESFDNSVGAHGNPPAGTQAPNKPADAARRLPEGGGRAAAGYRCTD
jgi:hypothetical protein